MSLLRRAAFLSLLTALVCGVYAQNSISLEAEIQSIEKAISGQGSPAAERHDALVRLARLRQLSGDIEGAAKNWLEAAAAVPGQVDDDALLACAYCLAAMGEWDRAAAALEPLLNKNPRAHFLDISIKAIKSGDTSALAALAASPQYYQMKNEIYFMLWKISRGGAAAERWRQQLLAEFPQSPEGRLAAGENTSPAIIVRPSPFWLFMGGLDSLPIMASAAAAPAAVTASVQRPAAAVSAAPPATASAGVRLQTGVFSRQANAQAQIEGLKKAGFSPLIEQRTVNNNEMWAVIVPAGPDTNHTIAALRSAGFESFPLR